MPIVTRPSSTGPSLLGGSIELPAAPCSHAPGRRVSPWTGAEARAFPWGDAPAVDPYWGPYHGVDTGHDDHRPLPTLGGVHRDELHRVVIVVDEHRRAQLATVREQRGDLGVGVAGRLGAYIARRPGPGQCDCQCASTHPQTTSGRAARCKCAAKRAGLGGSVVGHR